MKTTDFVNVLNSKEEVFISDSSNANNGYPILADIKGINVTFEDKILYEKILDKLLYKMESFNDDTMTIEMTQSNIDTVTSLNLGNGETDIIIPYPNKDAKIANINGIENFRNLTVLDLSFNNINDISKLQNLTKLEELDLKSNNISNIEAIAQLDKLKGASFNNNDIASIPVLNWTEIQYLDLGTNKLTDINNLSNLTNLEELYLQNDLDSETEGNRANGISDLSALDKLEKLEEIVATNQRLIKTEILGKEINLPKIFIQAKDEKSGAYTQEDFIINNCTLSDDGTKITLGQDTSQKATIAINGGILDGTIFAVTLAGHEIDGVLFTTDKTTLLYYPPEKNVENYIVPESVKTIGENAFKGNNKLKNIEISNNVQGIMVGAFYGCTNLREVILPEELKSIDSYAFYNCPNIEKIYLPSTVETMGTDIFKNCSNLVIICEQGSKSESYATINSLKYTFRGDPNGDHIIDFKDILLINKHRLGKAQLSGAYLDVADTNRDDKIDFMDILQVNKYRLGKIDSL